MPLINALRRTCPSVSLESRIQPSGCPGPVHPLRHYALRAEPATGAIDPVRFPPGGNSTDFSRRDRSDQSA
jgi:hypothetical protein